MKQLTNGKIIALCMGDFARGMINGIITTYLLTFFIPTNANTTLPQFFLKAALVMYMVPMVLFFVGYALGAALFQQGALAGCLAFFLSIGLAVVYDRKVVKKQNTTYTITGFAGK